MSIDISKVQQFHGHMCPGLAIGIRVAEQALLEMGERPGDEEVVAIAETNNCAVDAIQFVTGCTLGKGNLIHLDYGKNAFRFIRRSDAKAIRIRVVSFGNTFTPAEEELMKKWRNGSANVAERQQAVALRQAQVQAILNAPLPELLEVQTIKPEIPPLAKIYDSVICERCGEKTMEARIRRHEGKSYCAECYSSILQS